MSHAIRTQVTHRFDLTEQEQFEYQGYRKSALMVEPMCAVVESMCAVVVDGSLQSVQGFGRQVLKSGALGQVGCSVDFFHPLPEHVWAVLRAHGIPVGDSA